MPGEAAAVILGPDGQPARGAPEAPPAPRGDGWSRSASGLWLDLREKALACLSTIKRVTGMPDYQTYLAHLRLRHPDWPIPSEREYFELYLQARYGDGPTRCC